MPSEITHGTLLKIAVPIMLSNVTEPLIGVVNTAVVGQLPNPALIGGVSVGGMIFAFLFWGFGFLRLSTSGLSAQATGAGDSQGLTLVLGRSLVLGLAIGLALLILAPVTGPFAIGLIGGSDAVKDAAQSYFNWRILAAPAALANFALLGWFVGQGRSVPAFLVQFFLNATNMAVSAALVLGAHKGIAGVGIAAAVAEYAGLGFGLLLAARRVNRLGGWPSLSSLLNFTALKPLLAANADIMVRTLCLLFAFAWYTSRGARMGDTIIAANTVLMNLFYVSAYLIDGFAYAAEALVGQSIGARDKLRYARALRLGTGWALGFGGLAAVAFYGFGPKLIALMSVDEGVRAAAQDFLGWAALTPLLGAACFLFDGIFTGALATREMRNMMMAALALYLPLSMLLERGFGNDGLWAGLCFFFLARSLLFAWRLPAVQARAFA